MLLLTFFAVIFVACMAFLFSEGIWTNAIRFVNVVMAILLAFNFWEPLAALAYQWQPTFTYFWDFLILWGLFGVSFTVLRVVTDAASKVRVRFLKLADRIGSGVLSVIIAWVLICFTATTLHTAPLPRVAFNGGFVPEERAQSIFSPEIQLLGFVQYVSMGVYARSAPKDDPEAYVFDPLGEFLPKYAGRRGRFESYVQNNDRMVLQEGEATSHY